MNKKIYSTPSIEMFPICLATAICSGQQPSVTPAPSGRPESAAPERRVF